MQETYQNEGVLRIKVRVTELEKRERKKKFRRTTPFKNEFVFGRWRQKPWGLKPPKVNDKKIMMDNVNPLCCFL